MVKAMGGWLEVLAEVEVVVGGAEAGAGAEASYLGTKEAWAEDVVGMEGA